MVRNQGQWCLVQNTHRTTGSPKKVMSKSHGAFVHQNLRPTHLFLHLGWGAGGAGVSSLPQLVHHSIFPIFIKENFHHMIKKNFKLLSYHCYIQDFYQRLFQEKLLWISTFLKLDCLGPARLTGSSEKGRSSPKAKSESEATLVSSLNSSPEHSLPSSSPVSADQREFRAEDRRRGRCWGPG